MDASRSKEREGMGKWDMQPVVEHRAAPALQIIEAGKFLAPKQPSLT
jgi:hypothetical protein